jgi:hypothetical protein
MKIIYSIVITLLIFLAGCSSTYRISDFPSEEKFYENINNSIKNKNVKITLVSDSTFFSNNIIRISNDTLILIEQVKVQNKFIEKNDTRKIKFYFNELTRDYSADIILRTGEYIKADNIELMQDSSIQFSKLYAYNYFPLSNVKEISFKNIFLGSLIGFGIGIPSGYGLGALIGSIFNTNNKDEANSISTLFLTCFIAAPVISGILGSIIGYTYTYEFNP